MTRSIARNAAQLALVLGALCATSVSSARPPATVRTSAFTSLGKACTAIKGGANEVDSAMLSCPGYAGFHVLLDYGDARESLRLKYPDATVADVPISTHFNSYGPKLEWRGMGRDVKHMTPDVLIARVSISRYDDGGVMRHEKYLRVFSIGSHAADLCLLGQIDVQTARDANAEARQMADASASKRHRPAAEREEGANVERCVDVQ